MTGPLGSTALDEHRPAVALARMFPGLLTMGARHTRLPRGCERVFKPLRMG